MKQEIKMKSEEFIPMGEFLLVKADLTSNVETTSGGILIQHKTSVLDRPSSGVVVAAGKDCLGIGPNDYVVFPDTDGIDVKFQDSNDGNKFMLLRYKSIIGKKNA